MKSTRNLQPAKMEKILKEHKIRECHVKVSRLTTRNSVLFLKALLQKHRIRNCVVNLRRLNKKVIDTASPKFRLKPLGTVRSNSNISWFPASSTIRKNSVDARSYLTFYQNENGVVKPVVGRKTSEAKSNDMPAKRQRAKSMFIERIQQANRKIVTIDDMNQEFSVKFNTQNRGLKSVKERKSSEPLSTGISVYQKICEEFKAKIQAKIVKK